MDERLHYKKRLINNPKRFTGRFDSAYGNNEFFNLIIDDYGERNGNKKKL